MIHHIGTNNSIMNQYISEIRDVEVQGDRMRFRTNVERIGQILAYELSKKLEYSTKSIVTPLEETTIESLDNKIVIMSILRAGLTLHNGLLSVFDNAENAFISAYRHHTDGDNFEIKVEYLAGPNLDGKTLILVDPMLATGRSIINCYDSLLNNGTPESLHVVSCIASQQGVDFVAENLPAGTDIWVAAIDPVLNSKAYIVPGLGDAGDLAYGEKL